MKNAMKPVHILLLVLLTGCSAKKELSVSQTPSEEVKQETVMTDFHDPSTWLLGYFTRDMMRRTPHCEWYIKGYDEYNPEAGFVNYLTEAKSEDLTIKIVMGSWCPDSRREVPRFLKILDLWKFPAEKITFIGVDDAKLSPVGEYESLNIQRVPTFIIYEKNIEAGRIIEVPLTSLEQDMVNILKGMKNN
jgi:thiol-disulfide isomerase/thioredoxin